MRTILNWIPKDIVINFVLNLLTVELEKRRDSKVVTSLLNEKTHKTLNDILEKYNSIYNEIKL